MRSRTAAFLTLALSMACSPPSSRGPGGSGGNGGGSGGGAGGNGGGSGGQSGAGGSGGSGGGGAMSGSDASVGFTDGKSCGEQQVPIPVSPGIPDVVIVFDRSGSMGKSFGSGTRFTTERDILKPLVTMYQDRIRWGFEEFPTTGGGCCAGGVCIPPALNQAMEVNNAIDGNNMTCRNMTEGTCPADCYMSGGSSSCGSGTPTPSALRNVANFYAGFVDGVKNRYVLLSTDGEPNCLDKNRPGNQCQQSADWIKEMAATGVKTIVLGVSEEVSGSACLESLAKDGGAPRPGAPPSFYPGSDPAALAKVLPEIIGALAKPSCSIDLTTAPPDPLKIGVFFDGTQIPWDPTHTDGWDYDPPGSTMRITIYGSYCMNLQDFKVMNVEVRYGCPPCGGTVSCG